MLRWNRRGFCILVTCTRILVVMLGDLDFWKENFRKDEENGELTIIQTVCGTSSILCSLASSPLVDRIRSVSLCRSTSCWVETSLGGAPFATSIIISTTGSSRVSSRVFFVNGGVVSPAVEVDAEQSVGSISAERLRRTGVVPLVVESASIVVDRGVDGATILVGVVGTELVLAVRVTVPFVETGVVGAGFFQRRPRRRSETDMTWCKWLLFT